MFRNPVTDLLVVVVVALLIFGPKRLPMLGRALGHGFREFKEGITGQSKPEETEQRPALASSPGADSSPQPTPTAASAPNQVASERESAEAGSAEHRA